MRASSVRHEFVETVPDNLEDGVVYVCIGYATAVHLCCCGCKSEVVTPLSPTDWSVTFDGQSISLRPSIGNWSFPCRSHYWIMHNRVAWARRWNQEQVSDRRQRDARTKQRYFESGDVASDLSRGQPSGRHLRSILRWLRRWYRGHSKT